MPSSLELAARLSAVVNTQQQVLAAVADPERVMKLIVGLVPEVTSGAGAVIELVEGSQLVYRAATGSAAQHIGFRLDLQGSLSGLSVQKREVIRCDDAASDPRVDGAACLALGIRSMIVAPLLQGQSSIGVLKTFSPLPNAFDDLDAYTLQLLAGLTAAALIQAETFRERQISEQRYQLLFDKNIAGVFRTTRNGKILDCNEALAGWLGYSRDELVGRESWELYPQRADRERFLQDLERERAMTNVRLELKRKDGSPLKGIVNVAYIPADDGDMQLLGTMVPAAADPAG